MYNAVKLIMFYIRIKIIFTIDHYYFGKFAYYTYPHTW